MPATVSYKEAVSYSHPSRLNLFSSRILFFKPVIPLSQSSYFGFTDLPQSFLLSLDIGPGSLSDMVLSFIHAHCPSRSSMFMLMLPRCIALLSLVSTVTSLVLCLPHVFCCSLTPHTPPCFHVSMLLQNLLCCSTGQCLLFTFSMDVQPSIFLFTLIYPVINPKKNSIASSHDRFSVAVVTPNAHSDAFLTTRNEIWILQSFWHSSLYISSSPAFSLSPCRVVVFYPTQNPYNLRFYIYEY
ncbi:hypothetical protein F5879DRAFT_375764 [Lentinula edodes]|nr:hypothetical protein F5879DRAFT_375764 [Lentinula edodes]